MPMDFLGSYQERNPLAEAIGAYTTFNDALKKKKAEDEAVATSFMQQYTAASDENRTMMTESEFYKKKVAPLIKNSSQWGQYVKTDEQGNTTLSAPYVPPQTEDWGVVSDKDPVTGKMINYRVSVQKDTRTGDYVRDENGTIVQSKTVMDANEEWDQKMAEYDRRNMESDREYGLRLDEAKRMGRLTDAQIAALYAEAARNRAATDKDKADPRLKPYGYNSMADAENKAADALNKQMSDLKKSKDPLAMAQAFNTYKSYLANSPDGAERLATNPNDFTAYAFRKFESSFGADQDIMNSITKSLTPEEYQYLFKKTHKPVTQKKETGPQFLDYTADTLVNIFGTAVTGDSEVYSKMVLDRVRSGKPLTESQQKWYTDYKNRLTPIQAKLKAGKPLTREEEKWLDKNPGTESALKKALASGTSATDSASGGW